MGPDDVWKALWGNELKSFPELQNLVSGYMKYLEGNRETLNTRLSKAFETKAEVSGNVLDYVAFASLGPRLVDGHESYQAWVKQGEPLANAIERARTAILEDSKNWGGMQMKEIAALRRNLSRPTDRRSDFRARSGRLFGFGFDRALTGLYLDITGPAQEESLGVSYVTGVVNSRSIWDEPECVSGAVSMVVDGLVGHLYSQSLQRAFVQFRGRPDRGPLGVVDFSALITRWTRLEESTRALVSEELKGP